MTAARASIDTDDFARARDTVYLAVFPEHACWMQVMADAAGGPKDVTPPEEAHRKKRISRPENQITFFNYTVRRTKRRAGIA